MANSEGIVFILVAAGSGTRLGGHKKKQFLKIGDKDLFQYPLELFLAFCEKNLQTSCKVVLVLPPDTLEEFVLEYDYSAQINSQKLLLVSGGNSRAESVFNGISSIKNGSNILIIVHDAARPLLNLAQLGIFIKSLNEMAEGSILVSGKWAKDTILISNFQKNRIINLENRDVIFQAETPQGFYMKDYLEILENVQNDSKSFTQYTDESSLFLKAKKDVIPINIEGFNFKITFQEDLEMAHLIIAK